MPFTVENRFLVPPKDFQLGDRPTRAPRMPSKEKREKRLQEAIETIRKLQRNLQANDRHSLLLMFQGMDAAGKDGTIRAVLSGVDPSGVDVAYFKQPSAEELDHDFLWRHTKRLPERGRIGAWNRSWYEEVLIVRVHPNILERQRLPDLQVHDGLWEDRFQSIRDMERHLSSNGTVILKFFLHVGREEQRKRFLERIEDPATWWKFQAGDVEERRHWDDYQKAFEEALAATSRPGAPWYAVPADSKSYLRMAVAEIVAETLTRMDPKPAELGAQGQESMATAKRALLEEVE